MENNVEWLEKELKKKNRKEKINRLKRIGKLEFKKVNNLKELKEILPLLIFQNDLRKGAMYGKTAFIDEPKKQDFLIDLFNQGLLHVSILKLNEEIIASNAGIQGDGKVYLQGLNTISPYHMKFSPGILHFLMLGLQLASEEIPIFDLTPGGSDGYKSMLSSETWNCSEIIIGTRYKIKTIELKRHAKALLKETRIGKRTLSDQFKKIHHFFSTINLLSRTNPVFKIVCFNKEANKSHIPLVFKNEVIPPISDNFAFKLNELEYLFLIGQKLEKKNRKGFYQDCINRMESGQSFYAILIDKNCRGILWTWKTESSEPKQILGNQYEFSILLKIKESQMIQVAETIHFAEKKEEIGQILIGKE
jgi:hypothetical protein